MKNPPGCPLLLATAPLAGAALAATPVAAQTPALGPKACTYVHAFAEQVPWQPGNADTAQLVAAAIEQNYRYPTDAVRQGIEGRLWASFSLAEDGRVRVEKILKSLSPSCDTAALAAVRQLPRFAPGKLPCLPGH